MYAVDGLGIYKSVTTSIQKMGNGFDPIYYPNPKNVEVYKSFISIIMFWGNL